MYLDYNYGTGETVLRNDTYFAGYFSISEPTSVGFWQIISVDFLLPNGTHAIYDEKKIVQVQSSQQGHPFKSVCGLFVNVPPDVRPPNLIDFRINSV